jgi:hypothetical protein
MVLLCYVLFAVIKESNDDGDDNNNKIHAWIDFN